MSMAYGRFSTNRRIMVEKAREYISKHGPISAQSLAQWMNEKHVLRNGVGTRELANWMRCSKHFTKVGTTRDMTGGSTALWGLCTD